MSRWLLVSGDFAPLGGMDRANHALATWLAARGDEVHLVTHRAWPDLTADPRVVVHRVWRPLGSHALGKSLLSRAGRRHARALAGGGGRVVVNGGNCPWPDVNWVHYVHAAFDPAVAGLRGPRHDGRVLGRARDLADERRALADARVVICNSRRTRNDVVEKAGVPADRAHVVYYGVDADRFAPAPPDARARAREALGLDDGRPVAIFIGALGDRRKGFDTLFAAWATLCRDRAWDADLLVAGRGRELALWRRRSIEQRLDSRVRFLGFTQDVPTLMAAADVLVHPARYEAYGLAVHEALSAGVPALVTRCAGVAEQYPPELRPLLIDDADDAGALANRLREWRRHADAWRARTVSFGAALRRRTWRTMAEEIVAIAEQAP